MNRILMILLATILICGRTSAQTVTFRFEEGTLSDASLREKMEKRISSLLSEITKASKANQPLNFDFPYLTSSARMRLAQLWENMHFSCDDTQIVEKCLPAINGYVVRDILVTIHPADNSYDGPKSSELAICFDANGFITSVRMALESSVRQDVLAKSHDTDDFHKRMEILWFIEELHSYYDEKDLKSLHNVFSKDALVIINNVVLRKNMDTDQTIVSPEILCRKFDNNDYMKRLTALFNNNKFIKVRFDEISVRKHPAKPGFYIVTLHQTISAGGKVENGYMYMLWEFRENQPPIIHFRTWLSEMENGHSQTLDEKFLDEDLGTCTSPW